MKNIVTTTAFIATIFVTPVWAADDFGAHFMDQTPLGFSDVKPNDDSSNIDGLDLNTIEPAAGDAQEQEEAVQDVPQSNQEPADPDSESTVDEISL